MTQARGTSPTPSAAPKKPVTQESYEADLMKLQGDYAQVTTSHRAEVHGLMVRGLGFVRLAKKHPPLWPVMKALAEPYARRPLTDDDISFAAMLVMMGPQTRPERQTASKRGRAIEGLWVQDLSREQALACLNDKGIEALAAKVAYQARGAGQQLEEGDDAEPSSNGRGHNIGVFFGVSEDEEVVQVILKQADVEVLRGADRGFGDIVCIGVTIVEEQPLTVRFESVREYDV